MRHRNCAVKMLLLILYVTATTLSLKYKDLVVLEIFDVKSEAISWTSAENFIIAVFTSHVDVGYVHFKGANLQHSCRREIQGGSTTKNGYPFFRSSCPYAENAHYRSVWTTARIAHPRVIVKPSVTFTPNWGKVFTGESVTMACVVDPPEENLTYLWYKDSNQLQIDSKMFTIDYTQTGDTGDYQCQTPTGEISESVRLEVIYGYLILQAPAIVYEGDDVFLRCYSWPGYSVRRTIFYMDKMEFKPSDGNTGLLLSAIKREMSGKYRCAKKSEQSSVTTYTDESFIHVRELFSNPEIKVAPNPVLEGDEMTLTCYTKLSPLRQTTRLLFAFYRDGRNVQGLCPSNKYGVQSVNIEDSKKYSCAVETVSRNVRRESPVSYIQVHELFSSPLINMQPNQTTEGDLLSLTCNTSVSQHRRATKLLFAFYMDGGKVQGFNISNTYQIPSVQLKDSGNYSCQVKTSTNNVQKGSQEIHVQVEGTKSINCELQNLVRLGISSFLLIVWIMLITWCCKCFRRD